MRVRGIVLGVVTAAIVVVFGAPAGAVKVPDPCKVLKTSEIGDAFGVTVAAGQKGTATPVNIECTYAVPASGTRPAGQLFVRLMFQGGKPAYAGLKTNPQFTPVPEVSSKSLYQASTGALGTLKGDTYVTVQGVFRPSTLPPTAVDVKAQLIPLAKIAAKRA